MSYYFKLSATQETEQVKLSLKGDFPMKGNRDGVLSNEYPWVTARMELSPPIN